MRPLETCSASILQLTGEARVKLSRPSQRFKTASVVVHIFLPQTRRGPASRVRESFSLDRRQFLFQFALNSTLFNSQPRTTPTSSLCYREPSLLHDGSQPSKPAVHDFDDPIARFALRCQPQAKPTWPTSFSHRAIHLDAHISDRHLG